jgi:hypothetical protein
MDERPTTIDGDDLTARAINEAVRVAAGAREIVLEDPAAWHNVGVWLPKGDRLVVALP